MPRAAASEGKNEGSTEYTEWQVKLETLMRRRMPKEEERRSKVVAARGEAGRAPFGRVGDSELCTVARGEESRKRAFPDRRPAVVDRAGDGR
jgi:hypothetical protein